MKTIIRYLLFPGVLSVALSVSLLSIHADWHPEIIVTLLVLSAMFVVHLGERIAPYRADWNLARGDVKTDLTSLAVIVLVLDPLIKVGVPLLLSILLISFGESAVWHVFPNQWPLLGQLAVFALGAEFGRYWIHRFSHSNHYLWRVHALHHSAERLYLLNGYRIHPFNFFWNYFFGQLPLILLGAGEQVVMLYFALSSIIAAFQHANIDSKNGVLNWVFSTNELHRWHHTTDDRVGYKNHGSVLILWDQLFGTYYSDKTAASDATNIDNVGLSSPKLYPANAYFRQVIAPFCWQRCVNREP